MNKEDYNVTISDRKDGSIVVKVGDGFFFSDFEKLAETYGFTADRLDKEVPIAAFKSEALRMYLGNCLMAYLSKIDNKATGTVYESTIFTEDGKRVKWQNDFTFYEDVNKQVVTDYPTDMGKDTSIDDSTENTL